MYNRIVTRKISRTGEPNTPDRVAQTVDAVVAKWIPVTAALLACFVTPSRGKLDSRYYESPNYPVRAVQTVDVTVRTWIPTGDAELASFSTPARRPLDVRRYDWAPEFISIPRLIDPTTAKWEPAFASELASFSTSARAPLDVRRSEWAPEFVDLVNRVDGQVRTWMPAADAELTSFRTLARPSLDVRTYDWAASPPLVVALSPTSSGGSGPSASVGAGFLVRRIVERTSGPQDLSWVYGLSLGPTIWPAVSTEAQTIPAKRPDARAPDGSPGVAWIQSAIDPIVASWSSVFNAEALSARTGDRAKLDVRTYDWLEPFGIQNAITPTIASWSGVFTAQALSARTGDRSKLDGRSYDWAANPSFVVALSTGGSACGGSNANVGTGFVVRRVIARTTGPQDLSWFYGLAAPAGPTVAQTAPAWTNATRNAERTPSRRSLDVRTYDWIQPFGVEDDPAWRDALLYDFNRSYRTPARAKLDVRQYEWSQPAWIYTNIPAGQAPPTQAQISPAILQGSGLSYRTAARSPLDVRRFEWAPASGWLPSVVDAVVGRWVPVWNEELNAVRTSARARLDVRTYDWAPEFDWVQRVTDAVIAKWIPVFDAEVSYRTPDGPRLNVRELTSAPEPAFWAAIISTNPAAPTDFFIVDAQGRWFTVDAQGRWFVVDAIGRWVTS